MDIKTIHTELEDLIANDKLHDAIEALLKLFNIYKQETGIEHDEHDTILIQSGILISCDKDDNLGIADYNDIKIIRNKVRKVIRDVQKKLSENFLTTVYPKYRIKYSPVDDKRVNPKSRGQFKYDIFFSFSSIDLENARECVNMLRGVGFEVFFSTDSLKQKVGSDFIEVISEALKHSNHFVWYSTPNSHKSKHTKREANVFYNRFEEENKRKFILLKGPEFSLELVPDFYSTLQIAGDVREVIEILTEFIPNDLEEAHLWENTVSENTIGAYENYIKRYPNGKFAKEALTLKNDLEEAHLWENIVSENTIGAYENYIKRYPNGKFAKEALTLKNDLEEAHLWENTVSENTIGAYENYIKRYPNGKFAKEALTLKNDLEEAHLWENTVSENTIGAYENYIKRYPNGKFAKEALTLKNDLEEAHLWENTVSENTIGAYENYIKRYPNGKFAKEALTLKNDLEEAHLWENTVSENTIGAYENYIKRYPNGKFAKEALTLKNDLEEAHLWENTVSENTIGAYENYMKRYPNGKFAKEAWKNLQELQREIDYQNIQKRIATDKAKKDKDELWLRLLNERENRKKAEEEKAWLNAQSCNTEKILRDFINTYPDSNYYAKAKLMIDIIHEKSIDETSWSEACGKNTIESYSNYYKSNPNGSYLDLAMIKIDNIKEESIWKKMKKNRDIETIKIYIQKNSNFKYKAEAQTLLVEIEESMWKEAKKMDTTDYYEYYINRFPEGKYRRDASRIISDKLAFNDIKIAEHYFDLGDYVNAARLYAKYFNHEQISSENLARLGWIYENGKNGDVDYLRSIAAYKKAISKGNIRVLTNLGELYEKGFGVSQDSKIAFKYYKESADKGEIEGVYHLGRMFENGIGVEQSKEKAKELYEIAAKIGHIESQNKLLNLKN